MRKRAGILTILSVIALALVSIVISPAFTAGAAPGQQVNPTATGTLTTTLTATVESTSVATATVEATTTSTPELASTVQPTTAAPSQLPTTGSGGDGGFSIALMMGIVAIVAGAAALGVARRRG